MELSLLKRPCREPTVGASRLCFSKVVSLRSGSLEIAVKRYGVPRYHGKELYRARKVADFSAIRVVPTVIIVPVAKASGTFYFMIL